MTARSRFLRRTWKRFSKLGRGRKKKQKWNSPKGRHSKTREKRGGYPVSVSIGYKGNNEKRNKIAGKSPALVHNIRELENVKDEKAIILGKIGKKKKMEIAKKAKEMKINIQNLNVKKFLKRTEKKAENKTMEEKK
nr:50S ribosomal protein L32e [uncultured archaeon]